MSRAIAFFTPSQAPTFWWKLQKMAQATFSGPWKNVCALWQYLQLQL